MKSKIMILLITFLVAASSFGLQSGTIGVEIKTNKSSERFIALIYTNNRASVFIVGEKAQRKSVRIKSKQYKSIKSKVLSLIKKKSDPKVIPEDKYVIRMFQAGESFFVEYSLNDFSEEFKQIVKMIDQIDKERDLLSKYNIK